MASPKKIASISRQLASRAGEDFHQLLQAINPQANGRESVVTLFTSSRSGEGVTTVAISFGHFLAEVQNQDRIALVEANFRAPCFGKLFGLPSSPSLMTALNKEAPIEETCYKIGSDSLAMIPAGAPGQGDDIFSTESGVNGLKKEIDQLRQSFKFIIIDAPPVIPYVDPTLLAGAADGVAVVVEANNTRAEVLDRACDRLKRSKANIWGMILNKREFHIPGWIYRFL